MFDRSWYNRAGVEPVMGFCTPAETEYFLDSVGIFEQAMVHAGIVLIKYWIEVSEEEQSKRLQARVDEPGKIWKLSGMDLKSYSRWWDYTEARDRMFEKSDTEWAPWNVVHNDDKRRGRLNLITHLLSQMPYETARAARGRVPRAPEEAEGLRRACGARAADPHAVLSVLEARCRSLPRSTLGMTHAACTMRHSPSWRWNTAVSRNGASLPSGRMNAPRSATHPASPSSNA